MLTTNARRGRQVAAAAMLAGAALLVAGCNSATGSSAAATSSAASAPASATPAGSPSVPASSAAPSITPSATASPSGTSTFLAAGQDINGTALHEPACTSGCVLSGDSTAILAKMQWTSWSATEAIGTGTYKLDGCNPSCAAGPIYPVATVITLSDPVKVCSSSGTRWFWSRASFKFPNGLPKALQGANAPQNPWIFSNVATAAQQTCST